MSRSVTLISSTISSVGEMVMPSLQYLLLAERDYCKHTVQLVRREPAWVSQGYRGNPEFGGEFPPFDMHVRRFR